MTPSVTWFDLAQLAIIAIPAILACLIGFLKFIEHDFHAKEKEREYKERELNENRQLFIQTVVEKHIQAPFAKVYDLLTKQDERHIADFRELNNKIDQWARSKNQSSKTSS